MSEPMTELEKQLREAAENEDGRRGHKSFLDLARQYEAWADMAGDLANLPGLVDKFLAALPGLAEIARVVEGKPEAKQSIWVCPECKAQTLRWNGEIHPCPYCETEMGQQHLVDLEEVLAVIDGSIAQYRHYSGQLMHPGAAIGPLRGIADKLRTRFGGGRDGKDN